MPYREPSLEHVLAENARLRRALDRYKRVRWRRMARQVPLVGILPILIVVGFGLLSLFLWLAMLGCVALDRLVGIQ